MNFYLVAFKTNQCTKCRSNLPGRINYICNDKILSLIRAISIYSNSWTVHMHWRWPIYWIELHGWIDCHGFCLSLSHIDQFTLDSTYTIKTHWLWPIVNVSELLTPNEKSKTCFNNNRITFNCNSTLFP